MGTTSSAGPIIHFELGVSTWVRNAMVNTPDLHTDTTTIGRQPANATKYVGAIPAFAKPVAATTTVAPKTEPQKVG